MIRGLSGKLAFASTAEVPAVSAPAARGARGRSAATAAERTSGVARWFRGGRLYLTAGAAVLVLAALSLLVPSTPSYDPWAWLVWGREIIHLDLHTTGGPTWKPLPALFTVPFALFGSAQPDLWLVVARAGALLAIFAMFRLSLRITRELGAAWTADAPSTFGRMVVAAGVLAGVIAAGSIINSSGFVSDNALGYSEGFAVALMLISVDRFLDGARRQAFVISFFAALDRPELWIFWGPYGLWLAWRDPGARKLVAALFVLIPVLWFLPELWGSGQLLRGVTRAQHPRSNSAAFTSCPVCTVFKDEAWHSLLNRVKVPALVGLAAAAWGLWRLRGAWWHRASAATAPRRSSAGVSEPGASEAAGAPDAAQAAAVRARAALLAIGAFGFIWWIGIALETQAHFSGNQRYLVLGSAPVAIAGGVSWGWFAQSVARAVRWLAGRGAALRRLASVAFAAPLGLVVAIGLFLAVPPWIGSNVISLPRTHRALVYQALLRTDAAAAVRQAGGAAKLLRCGTIMTEGFQVPMVAWTLGVRTLRVQAPPSAPAPATGLPSLGSIGPAPNVILQTRETRNATLLPLPQDILAWERAGAHYKLLVHNRTFRLFSTCA